MIKEKGPTHMIKPETKYSRGSSRKYRMPRRRNIPAMKLSRRGNEWTLLGSRRRRHWGKLEWRRGDGGGLGEVLSLELLAVVVVAVVVGVVVV